MNAEDKISQVKKSGFFRKGDIVLLIVMLIFSIAVTLIAFAFKKDYGGRAEIYMDNVLIASLALNENKTYNCETKYGKNVIEIKDGKAFVSQADCSDQTCVFFGKIERSGEVIYCLPHGLKIVIAGDAKEGVGDR